MPKSLIVPSRALYCGERRNPAKQMLFVYKRPILNVHLQWDSNRSFPHIFLLSSEKKRALSHQKNSVSFQLHHSRKDPGGRFIILFILICDINNVTVVSIMCTIVNVYVPNSHQFFFLNKLQKKVGRVKQGASIWCRDFNAIVDASIDSTSKSLTPPFQLHSWLLISSLYDAWRCCHAVKTLRFTLIPIKRIPKLTYF